jgi:hypothetical protein
MTMAQPMRISTITLYFVSLLGKQSLSRSPDAAADTSKDGKPKAEDTSSATSDFKSNQPSKWECRHKTSSRGFHLYGLDIREGKSSAICNGSQQVVSGRISKGEREKKSDDSEPSKRNSTSIKGGGQQGTTCEALTTVACLL